MSSSEAKNLEVIARAIEDHNTTCPYPAIAVVMTVVALGLILG